MGIFTKFTNWLYGTTPSIASNKGTGSSGTVTVTVNAKTKKPAAKKPTKKSTGKKTKK